MTSAFIDPAITRVLLPSVLAVGYACCHWWRWRMMHPKIDLDRLPTPSATVIPVTERQREPRAAKMASSPMVRSPARGGAMPTDAPVDGSQTEGVAQPESFREVEDEMMRLDCEAFDIDTLTLFFRRARFRPEYYVRLGECAWYRGAMVETHFWLSMAMYRGVQGLEEWLDLVRKRWLTAGRPDEWENEYDIFPPSRCELARAHLMYVTRLSGQVSHDTIVNLAQEGNKDAQFILARIG